MAKKKNVPTSVVEEVQKVSPEQEEQLAKEKQEALLKALNDSYLIKLDEEMGKLHNQFVGFISASKLPLPQVFLVLEILKMETVNQAFSKYIGGK